MLFAFARARRWQRLIDEGRISSAKALAAKIGRDQSYVANIIGMVQISPKIIHAVIRGGLPEKPDAGDAQEEAPRPLERAGGDAPRRELAPHRERTQGRRAEKSGDLFRAIIEMRLLGTMNEFLRCCFHKKERIPF